MNDILSELYLGNYRPFARSYAPDSPYLQQSIRVADLADELTRALPEELKQKFQQYTQEYGLLLDLEGAEDFREGFRLGMRLILAALDPVSQ